MISREMGEGLASSITADIGRLLIRETTKYSRLDSCRPPRLSTIKDAYDDNGVYG